MIGTILGGIGGLVSAAGGLYSANQEAKNQRAAEANRQANIARANAGIDQWNKQAGGMLDQYDLDVANAMGKMVNMSNPGNLYEYQQMRDSMNPSDYIYNFDRFDSSKYNVDDYVNQNKDAILSDVGKAFQSTAAGAGLGHSSGTATGILNAQMDKSEQLMNDAYNRMNSDKMFDYSEYQNYITNMQNKLNTQLQIDQMKMNNLRGDIQFDQNQNMQQLQMKQDQLNNRLGLGNSIAQSKAALV